MPKSPSAQKRVHTRLAFVGLVALVGAGCIEKDPPGVSVQRLSADIVFGVEAPAPDAPPANTTPGGAGDFDPVTFVPARPTAARPPAGGTLPAPNLPAPRAPRQPTVRPPRPTPVSPTRSACPPAALNAFPAVEAGLTLNGTPAEGLYRWKRAGSQTLATLPGVAIPVTGFESRIVRNIVRTSPTEFTYETIQPELGTGVTVISTFKVKTDGVQRTVEPPLQSLPVAPPDLLGDVDLPTFPTTTVGDPERGISLKRIERIDGAGNSSVVEFTPAVLYLPLPIVAGESFEGVGVDSRTGQVLQHRGQVRTRERVDACGEVLDGWSVESTQTYSGQQSATRAYKYIFAPQLGGLLIAEKVVVTGPAATTDVTFSIGQSKPSPLPTSKVG